MNAYRFAVGSAALSAILMAGCDEPAVPTPPVDASRPDPSPSALAFSSGTTSAQGGLHARAELIPMAPTETTLHLHQQDKVSRSGAGLRPSRGASGISP